MDIPIHFNDGNLWYAAGCIIFNPSFWNVAARWEYRSRKFSKTIGSARNACIIMGVTITVLGIIRDWRFGEAILSQPRHRILQHYWVWIFGYMLVLVGSVLVLFSFLRLGFFGTFLGDYFGILMDERVTGFPFNIVDNPMYLGTSLNFLGYAVVQASPSGIVLSALVALVYKIAAIYEGEFTTKIYNEKDSDKKIE